MTTNRSDKGAQDALLNEIIQLRRDFDEFRSTPQRIGNGSLNYGVFSPAWELGPITIGSAVTYNITVAYLVTGVEVTYDGKPAINRVTLMDQFYSIKVDVDDNDHIFPYGASLTAAQKKLVTTNYFDYLQTGLSETTGQRYVVIQINNFDTSSHDYYVTGSALIPRPALKPQ